MIYKLTKFVRERFHPLHRLRRSRLFVEHLMPLIDVPIWCQLYRVKWPVRVHLVRHLAVILNSRIIEPEVGALFLAIEKVICPAAFWDVGANIGFFSWLMLSQNETLEVVLFEPDIDHSSLLRQTVSRAALTGAHVIASAVSDRSGVANFAVDKASGATGSLSVTDTFSEKFFHQKPMSISVNTISLDEVLASRQFRSPDLVKIDVETFEHMVFRGAKQLLSIVQPVLIFECVSSNKEECIGILRQLDYRLFNADNASGTTESALNLLALPPRFHSKQDELLARWKAERDNWGKMRAT